jgi:hypothetical protein
MEDSSSEEEKVAVRRRPMYKDPSSSEESESEEEEEEDQEEEQDDGIPIHHYSEKEMGLKGATFTEADTYITAKYIASFPQWEDAAAKERWEPFAKKVKLYLSSGRNRLTILLVPPTFGKIVGRILSKK